MEKSFSLKGGASVGAVNASWPMATLEVSERSLLLKVKIVGTYEFGPDDVVSLEPHGFIPVIGKGIRIVHCKPEYSSKIIFFSTEKPEAILQRIREAGFAASASAERTAKAGAGIRLRPIILLIVLMTLLPALVGILSKLLE